MTELFPTFWEITFRSLFSIIFLFFLAKIIGPRQIAQLTFYDYVIGISVGSIAAAVAIEQDVPLWSGVWAMIIYILVSVIMAWSGNKSILARRFFSGTPKILFANGKIIEKNLSKENMDLNDLLGACRSQGYFYLEDLEYIILEINGSLSFLQKSEMAPLCPKDMGMHPSTANLNANVIIDGNVMKKHLAAIEKSESWLQVKLLEKGYKSPEEILLATATQDGAFYCYPKNQQENNGDLFD